MNHTNCLVFAFLNPDKFLKPSAVVGLGVPVLSETSPTILKLVADG